MMQTVTHKDLARLLKVSETTVKSYRRKFADCIPVASKGKPIRFMPEAVDVCLRIRDYFEMGMSIEEVRTRLAQEFSWISVMGGREEPEGEDKTALPREFLISVSNLAKSMVTMTQQQNSIMDRMAQLEKAFENGVARAQGDSPAATTDLKPVLEDLQIYLRNALSPLQQFTHLADMENVAQMLHQSAASLNDAVQLLRDHSGRNAARGEVSAPQPVAQADPSSKVVAFPTAENRQAADRQPATAAPLISPVQQDPPRAFLLKPMVLRTVEGVYTGAGGRSRGRFTLNDLKALLAYGRQPSEHFTMIWEQLGGQDWAVTLTQPEAENSGTWRLQLREAMSQTGVGIVELVGFTSNGEAVHPSEFFAFVSRFSGGDD